MYFCKERLFDAPKKCLFLHKKVVLCCIVFLLLIHQYIVSKHIDGANEWVVLKHPLPLQVMYTMKCIHSVYAGTYATSKYVFYVIVLGLHIDTHWKAILCALCVFTNIYWIK